MRESRVPALVAAYYDRCLRVAPEVPRNTVLEQVGEIRLAPERRWIPFTARQTLSSTESRFLWRARFKMAPFLNGVVEDSYGAGRGRLDAKIWGVIPVARGSGPEADRSEAQRYLAELVWCPMAMLHNPELRFEAVDALTVRVWIVDRQTYVDWLFDEEGDLIGARTTTRSRAGGLAQPWQGRFAAFKDFGGIRAPSQGEVWWDTPEGRFVYWRAEVTSLGWGSRVTL